MGFAPSDLQLTSTAFPTHGAIPKEHTGEGADTSPPLTWRHLPAKTHGLAVICHDPDAPLVAANGTYGFVHWVLYNIPAAVADLPEAVKQYTRGKNDMGNIGYNGPMPPKGHGKHHYYFWLLALDEDLKQPPGLTLWEFLKRAEPHVVGMNRLIGTYERH
ncbi:MAG: YbhB/YbcL family Raf kinase inhibitor-like protein [Gammaproteobacteria bacterium]